MNYYFCYNKDSGEILAYSENKINMSNSESIELEMETNHPFFLEPNYYLIKDGGLVRNFEYMLSLAKERKLSELQRECQKTIEAGFNYNYEGVDYWFSLDAEAQSNFISTYQIMRDGIISEVPWTVKVNNEYARLVVNVEMMKDLTLLILQHKTNNISKFRDILSPLVEGATSLEEVNSIKW